MKSEQLAPRYREVAKEYGAEFLDLAAHVSPSKKDGYHLEPEGHQKVAELLLSIIKV